jgi:TP901 family phage tail tape measure protein
MAVEETLVLRIVQRGAEATAAQLKKVGQVLEGDARAAQAFSKRTIAMGRSTRYVGRELTHNLSIPMLAIGGYAVKTAADWEQAMTNIATQTHYTQGQVDGLNKPLLELSRTTPQGPDQWSEALLHLAKIGVPANQVLDDLQVAAKGATIGMATLPDVAEAAGAAWLSGIKGGGDYNSIVKEMTAAAGTGNVTLTQFTRALGTGVLPTAKAAGLSIQDVFGALALLTDEGYQGSSAMAQMATALHYLYNPGAKASKALESIGLSGDALASDMRKPRGLLTALTDLHDHLGQLPGGAGGAQASQVLGNILPGGRGRVLVTLMNQLDRYQMKMDQIIDVQGKFEESFHKQMETPLNKLHTAWAGIQADLILLGSDLLPYVADAFEWLARNVHNALKWFDGLDSGWQKLIIIGLLVLGVLGPILSIVGLMVIAIGALVSPITLVILTIAALSAAIILLITHWKDVKRVAGDAWGWMKDRAVDAANIIIDGINGMIDGINKAIDAFNKLNPFGDVGRVDPLDRISKDGKPKDTGPKYPAGTVLPRSGYSYIPGSVLPESGFSHMKDYPKRGGAVPDQAGYFNYAPGARLPESGFSHMRDYPEQNIHVDVNIDGEKVGSAVAKSNRKKRSTR